MERNRINIFYVVWHRAETSGPKWLAHLADPNINQVGLTGRDDARVWHNLRSLSSRGARRPLRAAAEYHPFVMGEEIHYTRVCIYRAPRKWSGRPPGSPPCAEAFFRARRRRKMGGGPGRL